MSYPVTWTQQSLPPLQSVIQCQCCCWMVSLDDNIRYSNQLLVIYYLQKYLKPKIWLDSYLCHQLSIVNILNSRSGSGGAIAAAAAFTGNDLDLRLYRINPSCVATFISNGQGPEKWKRFPGGRRCCIDAQGLREQWAECQSQKSRDQSWQSSTKKSLVFSQITSFIISTNFKLLACRCPGCLFNTTSIVNTVAKS